MFLLLLLLFLVVVVVVVVGRESCSVNIMISLTFREPLSFRCSLPSSSSSECSSDADENTRRAHVLMEQLQAMNNTFLCRGETVRTNARITSNTCEKYAYWIRVVFINCARERDYARIWRGVVRFLHLCIMVSVLLSFCISLSLFFFFFLFCLSLYLSIFLLPICLSSIFHSVFVSLSFFLSFFLFLDASSHLYKRVCPTASPFVCPSVYPFVSTMEKRRKRQFLLVVLS